MTKQQKEEQERVKVEAERAKLIQEEQEERDRLKLEIETAALKTRSEKGDRLRTKLVAEPNNNRVGRRYYVKCESSSSTGNSVDRERYQNVTTLLQFSLY